MIQQQFYLLGTHLGMSNTASIALGQWVNRITNWISLIAMMNLPLTLYYPIKQIFEGMPEINISSGLEEALNNLMENKYVKASRIFDTKEGNINTLTLMILKENFTEEELIKGFNEIKSQIDRDFYTISYIIRLINKVIA